MARGQHDALRRWVADELFLTGTAAEIVPIVEVDARKIGNGGPVRSPLNSWKPSAVALVLRAQRSDKLTLVRDWHSYAKLL